MKYLIYILFVLVCVCSVCGELFIKNKKLNAAVFFVPLLAFFLLAILRADSVGIDTSNYRETYNSVRTMSFSEALKTKFPEYGFYGLQYLFSAVFKLPGMVFDVFNYLVICVSFAFAFCKFKYRTMFVSLFLFVGFFCMSFSGIRQAMSMSIIALAFSYYIHSKQENLAIKLLTYYLLVIVAILFHTAATIAVLIPLFFAISFEKFQIPYVPAFILLFLPFLLSRTFIAIAGFVPATSDIYRVFESRVSITLVMECVFVLLFFILFCTKIGVKFRNKMHIKEYDFKKVDSDYLWIIIIGCFWMSFNQSTTIFTRFSMFFFMGMPYFLVQISDTFENKNAKSIYMIGITLLMGLYFVYSTPTLGLTPYAFR